MNYANESLSKAAERQQASAQRNPGALGLPELSGNVVNNSGMQAEGTGYSPHYLASQMRELAEKYTEATPERYILREGAMQLSRAREEGASLRAENEELRNEVRRQSDMMRLARLALS